MSTTKQKILMRRARFVAAAVASLGVSACGGTIEPEKTDSAVTTDSRTDGPVACLAAPSDTGTDTPTPCLSAPFDAGADVGIDSGPTPCLEPPMPTDAG